MADPRQVQQELGPRIEGDVICDSSRRDLYSRAACLYRLEPTAVVRPARPEDVQETVRYACGSGLSITTRGAGSSVAGGAVGAGLILDMSSLDTFHREDPDSVRVGPGLTRDVLAARLLAEGRHFPVDPSSGGWCSVGGMVMTNASGPHSLLYGPTRSYVQEIRGVGADGEIHTFRAGGSGDGLEDQASSMLEEAAAEVEAERPAAPKCSSGYGLWGERAGEPADPLSLLCGSEGTLVLATEIVLRTPPVPKVRETAVVWAANLDQAVDAVCAARETGVSALEMLDDKVLDLLRRNVGEGGGLLPAEPEAVLLWIDADHESAVGAGRILEEALERVRPAEGRRLSQAEAERLRELRRRVSTLLKAEPGDGRRPARFIEDGCVPPSRLHEYVRGLRSLLEDAGLSAAPTFGHAGQGHLHCNPSVDLADPEDLRRVADVVGAHAELVKALGGVPSGEHGDGRLRSRDLPRLFPRSWPWMRKIKTLFDPGGVLNPDVKIPAGGIPVGPADHMDPEMRALRMDSREHRGQFLERTRTA